MAFDELVSTMTEEPETQDPTVIEWSSDGALMIEVDWSGERVRVQLEPEAMSSWTADVLTNRIMRLHRLALMRARAEQRARLNERGFAIDTTAGFPSQADVDEYRRTIDF
jgi:hypothetical protein